MAFAAQCGCPCNIDSLMSLFSRSVIFTAIVTVFVSVVPPRASSDDLRVLHLENELRRLQRQLDAQARRIDQLERVAGAGTAGRASAVGRDRADSSPAWLITTNWDRIRPGMKVVEVVALLGRPTSVRTDPQGRVQSLWYAMELGPAAVISGNVQVEDTAVTQVNRPALR
jgi:hypothetical protein